MVFALFLIILFQISTALPSPQPQFLVVLDAGVGHRSTPIPRWPTSLRSLTARGTNATVLAQFRADSNATHDSEPVGAFVLAYSSSTSSFFSGTGQGVVRSNVDGSEAKTILKDDQDGYGHALSITVAEKELKIYYGNTYTGLIKKANFDGSNESLVRNVSQGLDYSIPSYAPAKFFPRGIAVDEERGWLYWSSGHGYVDDGSIRRIHLNGSEEEQILVRGANTPGQISVVQDSLFWAEGGGRQTFHISSRNTQIPTGTLLSSSQSPLFFEIDFTGEKQTLGITSFAVYRNEVEQKVWFVVNSAGRTVFGKLVEVVWRGSGSRSGPVFDVLNDDTEDIGVPVGLEYV